ncbi:flagellar filament capping protein FliD [Sphingomonas sp.]|uniref:flagellar filament capping protein FliD n=1 Tax=Sphingomonas sp. TaxID=28214 RepID=UPI001B1F08B2|nr:flagellar filament capping protein FliD [Sphingomonas sp.]MBO9713941.1 flagellar filament capping protein FliD [Sphingomonas sp.]
MAIESIAKTLGAGSGIDINTLVEQLVDAQFSAKQDGFTKRGDTLTAQISSVSSLKDGISGFDTALKTLIKTGTLATQPTSSNTSILTASTMSGGSAAGLSTQVEVRQLAAAQSAYSAPVADKTAAIGTGTLTITFGTATVSDGTMTDFEPGSAASVDIAITSANSSLTGIRDAINAKNCGVTATIMSDSDGARLVLKSGTGATQAFTLTATEDDGAEGLAALDIGKDAAGTTIGTAAQDAIVAVDGVAIHRASNAILDLVTGIRLDLQSAAPGTKVTLGSSAPTDALSQAVTDVVDTYNELLATLKTATDATSGPLRNDAAAKALLRSLAQLPTQQLTTVTDGGPRTLAEIGVATNRDGTLRVDATRLATAMSSYESDIEAMFKASAGLSAQLTTITNAATSTSYGLGASTATYQKAQSQLADDQAKAQTQEDAMRDRLTKQFATMDAAVAAYKATQSQLQNQIDAWNSND